jgi:hypothetical protein
MQASRVFGHYAVLTIDRSIETRQNKLLNSRVGLIREAFINHRNVLYHCGRTIRKNTAPLVTLTGNVI